MYPAIAGKPKAVIGGATFVLPDSPIEIERAHDCACSRPNREPQGAQNANAKLMNLQNSRQPLEDRGVAEGFV
jgi:hypothetical protein